MASHPLFPLTSRRSLMAMAGASALLGGPAFALNHPPIQRLPTGVTVFVGRAASGPVNTVVSCKTFGDFYNAFGSTGGASELAISVQLFFDNGGVQAYVLSLPGPAPAASDYAAAYPVIDAGVDHFDLMVLPAYGADNAAMRASLWGPASSFCKRRNAMLLIDPPAGWKSVSDVLATSGGVDSLRVGLEAEHAAVFYPRVYSWTGTAESAVGPAGALAGLLAKGDASQGVWKSSPALSPVSGWIDVERRITEPDALTLNGRAVNTIRFVSPGVSDLGARTLAGADGGVSDYRYIPVKRLALHILESLGHGLSWVGKEPPLPAIRHGPVVVPLAAQIQGQVEPFMRGLYLSGAFKGQAPSNAYFVRAETNAAGNGIDLMIGFAPLLANQFVNLRLQFVTA